MSFNLLFKLASYCLVASGYVALMATGSVDGVSGFLFGAVLILSWMTDTERLRRRIPNWLLNLVVLAYFPLFVIDYKLLSQSFVLSTVHLTFFVSGVKLMTRATDRDYVFLYLISFAQLMAASTLTLDISFLLCLSLFLVSGVGSLILFEMRRSNARAQSQGRVQPVVVPPDLRGTGLELFARFPAGTLVVIILGTTLAILVLAAPLFLLMPRIALGIYKRPAGQTQLVSGFSERVELGEIGTIKESDVIVMKVRIGSPPAFLPSNIKWRGIALDHYDGRSWSRSRSERIRVPTQGKWYQLEESKQEGTEILDQTFFLEALSTDVLFAMRKVLAVSAEVRALRRDTADGIYSAAHPFHRIRYTAVSEIPTVDPRLIPLGPARIPDDVRRYYLQLPDIDPRIAELARGVTRGIANPFYRAQAIENHLRTSYGYSLQLRGRPNSPDPLAMFLFDIREGHCEYFASAMTIMLRYIGIPARLVNGFRAGEYNDLAEAFVVRQRDAHSWVEALIEPYGWVEFDPTPPDPPRPQTAWGRMISTLAHAVDLWWSEDVVNYDLLKQYQLVSAGRRMLQNAEARLRQFFVGLWEDVRSALDPGAIGTWNRTPWVPAALLLSLLLAGGGILFYTRRKWRRRLTRLFLRLIHRGVPRAAVVTFYAEALALLEDHGRIRSRGQTPLEFAHSLAGHPAQVPLFELTRLYNRARYGPPAEEHDLTEIAALLTALEQSLGRPGETGASA